MRLYITDLSAYTEGYLVGEWISLPIDQDLLAESIENVLQEGRSICQNKNHHEEYFITDFECSLLDIGEHDDPYKLNKLAETIENYTELDHQKLKLLEYEGYSVKGIISNGLEKIEVEIYDYSQDTSFTDVYELLAQDLVDEGCLGSIPTMLVNYIDYTAIGRDLSMDYTEFEHGVVGHII